MAFDFSGWVSGAASGNWLPRLPEQQSAQQKQQQQFTLPTSPTNQFTAAASNLRNTAENYLSNTASNINRDYNSFQNSLQKQSVNLPTVQIPNPNQYSDWARGAASGNWLPKAEQVIQPVSKFSQETSQQISQYIKPYQSSQSFVAPKTQSVSDIIKDQTPSRVNSYLTQSGSTLGFTIQPRSATPKLTSADVDAILASAPKTTVTKSEDWVQNLPVGVGGVLSFLDPKQVGIQAPSVAEAINKAYPTSSFKRTEGWSPSNTPAFFAKDIITTTESGVPTVKEGASTFDTMREGFVESTYGKVLPKTLSENTQRNIAYSTMPVLSTLDAAGIKEPTKFVMGAQKGVYDWVRNKPDEAIGTAVEGFATGAVFGSLSKAGEAGKAAAILDTTSPYIPKVIKTYETAQKAFTPAFTGMMVAGSASEATGGFKQFDAETVAPRLGVNLARTGIFIGGGALGTRPVEQPIKQQPVTKSNINYESGGASSGFFKTSIVEPTSRPVSIEKVSNELAYLPSKYIPASSNKLSNVESMFARTGIAATGEGSTRLGMIEPTFKKTTDMSKYPTNLLSENIVNKITPKPTTDQISTIIGKQKPKLNLEEITFGEVRSLPKEYKTPESSKLTTVESLFARPKTMAPVEPVRMSGLSSIDNLFSRSGTAAVGQGSSRLTNVDSMFQRTARTESPRPSETSSYPTNLLSENIIQKITPKPTTEQIASIVSMEKPTAPRIEEITFGEIKSLPKEYIPPKSSGLTEIESMFTRPKPQSSPEPSSYSSGNIESLFARPSTATQSPSNVVITSGNIENLFARKGFAATGEVGSSSLSNIEQLFQRTTQSGSASSSAFPSRSNPYESSKYPTGLISAKKIGKSTAHTESPQTINRKLTSAANSKPDILALKSLAKKGSGEWLILTDKNLNIIYMKEAPRNKISGEMLKDGMDTANALGISEVYHIHTHPTTSGIQLNTLSGAPLKTNIGDMLVNTWLKNNAKSEFGITVLGNGIVTERGVTMYKLPKGSTEELVTKHYDLVNQVSPSTSTSDVNILSQREFMVKEQTARRNAEDVLTAAGDILKREFRTPIDRSGGRPKTVFDRQAATVQRKRNEDVIDFTKGVADEVIGTRSATTAETPTSLLSDKIRPQKNELIVGYDKSTWADLGYPSDMYSLPMRLEKVTIRKQPNTEYSRELNKSEKIAWEHQNTQRKSGKPQTEILVATQNGITEKPYIMYGDRTGASGRDFGIIQNAVIAHPHPTDIGSKFKNAVSLPTPSEIDHLASIELSTGVHSVVSPQKVYSGIFPNTVTADKFQTEVTKNTLRRGRPYESDFRNTVRKDDAMNENISKRINQFYTTAIKNVANKYPGFKKHDFKALKELIDDSTNLKTKTNLSGDKVKINSVNDIFPNMDSNIEKGFAFPLSDGLRRVTTDANKAKGITGLEKWQSEVIDTLRNEEIKAYNNYREYIQARGHYAIGGKIHSADITKSDVRYNKEVTFKESSQKRNAERDLRAEFLASTQPNPHVSRFSNVKYNRGKINVLELPTTIIDKKAINEVPFTTKVKGRINKKIEDIKDTITDKIYSGNDYPYDFDMNKPITLGKFGSKEHKNTHRTSKKPSYAKQPGIYIGLSSQNAIKTPKYHKADLDIGSLWGSVVINKPKKQVKKPAASKKKANKPPVTQSALELWYGHNVTSNNGKSKYRRTKGLMSNWFA